MCVFFSFEMLSTDKIGLSLHVSFSRNDDDVYLMEKTSLR